MHPTHPRNHYRLMSLNFASVWHWAAIKLKGGRSIDFIKQWGRQIMMLLWCIRISVFTHSSAHKRTARCYTFWVPRQRQLSLGVGFRFAFQAVYTSHFLDGFLPMTFSLKAEKTNKTFIDDDITNERTLECNLGRVSQRSRSTAGNV